MKIDLRPYQKTAIEAVNNAFKECDSCLMILPTGSGKTWAAASMVSGWFPRRCLYIAHTDELIIQPYRVFSTAMGILPGIEKAHKKAPLHRSLTIASIQSLTLTERLERFPRDHFGYIIIDEAHVSISRSYSKVLDYFKGYKLVGMTATAFRTDLRPLAKRYQRTAIEIDRQHMINEGWLVPWKVERLHDIEIDFSNIVSKDQQNTESYDTEFSHALDPYLEEIFTALKEKASGRKILAFLPVIATSKKSADICRQLGIRAEHVDGKDPRRRQKIEDFSLGKIDILCNANLLHTGVDFPICDSLLMLKPTGSSVFYNQAVGRILRPLPGTVDGLETAQQRRDAIKNSRKPKAIIYDILMQHDTRILGPECMVSDSIEDADLIRKQRSGREEDLYELSLEIQRKREDALLEKILQARRLSSLRSGLMSCEEFASVTRCSQIINYKPVHDWEMEPVTHYETEMLIGLSIDPATVQNRGHMREVVNAIVDRKHKGLAVNDILLEAMELGIKDPHLKKKEDLTREIEDIFVA